MKLSEMKGESAKQGAQQNLGRKNMEQAYEELKDCSQEELMHRLQQEIAMQKQSGAFDYDLLVSTLERLKMYLPQNTYENMLRIVENFK